ncbi:MAG: sulfatase [Candidatus Fervidibacter sp.]|uniref:sulfatase n=1 Tax=Candidatus Fervidibacter sp. TaxID=3100871 RepID=UPI00404A271E
MNIVIVILDTLRKDHLGCYGNNWIQTPNLDTFSSESLKFARAYPESLPTLPVRRAIHTGKRTFPFRNWVPQKGDTVRIYGWQRIPEEQVTLSEILKQHGYTTAFVTDTYHQFKPSMNFHRGFDVWRWIRGQESYRYQPISRCNEQRLQRYLPDRYKSIGVEQLLRQYLANTADRRGEEDYFAPKVFREVMNLLEDLRNRQPFLLIVDSFDPHEPWDPPPQYVSLYDALDHDGADIITPLYGKCDWMTERQLNRMRANYAGEVTMVDKWFGHFINRLSDLKLLDNSLIIVLSYQGHSLGEQGVVGKIPWELYPELIDIPFLIRHPEGKGAGQTSDYFASTHDVAPTVLGVLGIEPNQPMDGIDLSVLLEGKQPPQRPHMTTGFNNFVWVRNDRYALICRNDGAEPKLYDLQNDPQCERDIASQKPEIVKQMFELVIEDAGGEPLPTYDLRRPVVEWYRH